MNNDDFALLRSLVEWRRESGWTHKFHKWDRDQHDHAYSQDVAGLSVDVNMHRLELFPGEPKKLYEVQVDQAGHLLFHGWPWSVRSAVNGIAAAEVIPPEMAPMHSSAHAAGRESAFDRDEWAIRDRDFGHPWCHAYSPEQAAEDLAECRRYYPHAWLEHRRNGSTDWVRVPEAGGNDADA